MALWPMKRRPADIEGRFRLLYYHLTARSIPLSAAKKHRPIDTGTDIKLKDPVITRNGSYYSVLTTSCTPVLGLHKFQLILAIPQIGLADSLNIPMHAVQSNHLAVTSNIATKGQVIPTVSIDSGSESLHI